ncbi:MAG: hypothetical protein C5B49_07550 [Bdellovibrio sp.]|nr:MAG: hypothetical protein C5B49_07550 [Bdellovibrio sp.]
MLKQILANVFRNVLPSIALGVLLVATSSGSAKELSAQDIRDRYQLNGDVYKVDGRQIVSGPEATSYWRPDRDSGIIKGDWSGDSENASFAIRYRFQVLDDRSIRAVIEEYAKQLPDDNGPEFKDLLEKKEFTIENLEPIVWQIKNSKGRHLVVRFYVSLREVSKPVSVDSLPVAGTGISVTDSAGFLWAEGVQFNGRYVGLTSHRGTLALSYVPFAGAREMGEAEGDKISLRVDKKFKINLKAATSFLPAGVTAKVYAVYLPEKKSKGVHSVGTFDTNKEDRVEKALKK